MNTLDAAYAAPTMARSLFIGGEFAGLGGTVHTIRPIIQYKQFFPVQKRRNANRIQRSGFIYHGL